VRVCIFFCLCGCVCVSLSLSRLISHFLSSSRPLSLCLSMFMDVRSCACARVCSVGLRVCMYDMKLANKGRVRVSECLCACVIVCAHVPVCAWACYACVLLIPSNVNSNMYAIIQCACNRTIHTSNRRATTLCLSTALI